MALCTEAGPQGLTASGCLMTTLLATGTSSFLKEDLDSTSASTADISQRKERILRMERGKRGIYKFCVSTHFLWPVIMEPQGRAQPFHLGKQHRAPR